MKRVAITAMVCESEGDLHFTSPKSTPMTSSFVAVTDGQELSLQELESLNGGIGLLLLLLDKCAPKKQSGEKQSAKDIVEKGIICQSGSSHQHGNHPDANCPDNSTQVKEGEGGCTDSVPF